MIQELINTAVAAREKAYAPYSGFRVGAALLTEGGKVYNGCNVENASYGLTCCAERAAVFKAVSEGDTKFKAIAVISDTEDFCTPCGACRQVLAEFGGDINVIMCNNRKEFLEQKVSQLLPGYFTLTPAAGNTTLKG
ncbi:cytidine deaminase [Desulfocucumis palustris]|uniref:Cytidine deaminase n=1 Tax=Desulfocucumis palustris TaxID=1898651 RepID=A0A2L2XBR6_9FIRM|nr:cytidine deaminase [Desulfocucumis palustris]GBF33759.1 cytidine deaminase [Desulfocucumis palustris]